MGIASDLSDIKDISDTIVANKVSKFCYTDTAYENNNANGVSVYNVNNEQNIPTADPSIMKVNETVVTKGWRTRASSITRMFMNHMLGRLSYNVNKLSDMFSSLLTAIDASLDTANGLATVNSSGKISLLDNVVNTGDSDTPAENGTDKFTTGGAFTELAKKAPVNHASSTTDYGQATSSLFGHVKLDAMISCHYSASSNLTTYFDMRSRTMGFRHHKYTGVDIPGGIELSASSTCQFSWLIVDNGVVTAGHATYTNTALTVIVNPNADIFIFAFAPTPGGGTTGAYVRCTKNE